MKKHYVHGFDFNEDFPNAWREESVGPVLDNLFFFFLIYDAYFTLGNSLGSVTDDLLSSCLMYTYNFCVRHSTW